MTIRAAVVSGRRAVVSLGAVAAVLAAAACGSSGSHAGPPRASTQPSVSASGTTASTPATTVETPTAPTSPSTSPSTSAPTTPPTSPPPSSGGSSACHASQLVGRWTYVVGSAGMGQVSADLSLQNTAAQACTIRGYPAFTLYSATGTPLPTHITPVALPVTTLLVQPGGWVHSTLRYSNSIPSGGEPTSGLCEPRASYVLVTVTVNGGSGTVRVDLDQPQSICGRGQIQAKPYRAGQS